MSSLAILMTASLHLYPCVAEPTASAPVERATPEPAEAFFLPVQRTNAKELAHALERSIDEASCTPLPRSGGVVYRGPAGSHERARQLAAQIEASSNALANAKTAVIDVRHRDAEELYRRLRPLMSSVPCVFGADPGRGKLLIRADEGVTDQLKNMVQAVDVPAPPVEIECVFLRSGGAGRGAAPKLPADLKPLAEALARFGPLTPIGRYEVSASAEERFQVMAMVRGERVAEINGRLVSPPTHALIRLELAASLSFTTGDSYGKSSDGPPLRFEVQTRTGLMLGQWTLLGSAPSGEKGSDQIILVAMARVG